MKQCRQQAKRLGAMLLSIAIVLSLLSSMVSLGGSAEAAKSFDAVEIIKSQGGVYRILEVLPDESMGTMGYLIAGQEPFAGWEQELALQGSAESRKKYAGALFDNLKDAKLLGTTGETPLTIEGRTDSAEYAEAYPWGKTDGLLKLKLPQTETATAKGSLTYSADGLGGYIYSGGYETVGKTKNGDETQIIDHFELEPEGSEGDCFWYFPNFVEVSAGVSESAARYTKATVDGKDIYTYVKDTSTLSEGEKLYYVTDCQAPSKSKSDKKPYAAIGAGFAHVQDSSGWFKKADITYTYVGEGGSYEFLDSGKTNYSITTDTVFYTGISNNNWLLKNVFDWEEGETVPEVRVSSVAASGLTQRDINSANLIVISRGYSANDKSGKYEVTDYSSDAGNETDISEQMSAALKAAAKSKPVVLDRALSSKSLRIHELIKSLIGENAAVKISKKNEDSYYYCADFPLADGFLTAYDEDLYKNEGALYLVAEQIKLTPLGDLLNATVCPATVLRYIIAAARDTAISGSLRVLEIQPGKTSEISAYDVRQWVGAAESVNVTIDTMSTSELVGKTDNLAELYDIAFIGSDVSDLITKDEDGDAVVDYYDDNMDGLIYTNIGDTVISGGDSGFSMSGLLDRDYNTSAAPYTGSSYPLATGYRGFGDVLQWFASFNNTTRTFRYSGNDLTDSKLKELVSFAKSGHPVILGNDLTSTMSLGSGSSKDGKGYYSLIGLADGRIPCDYRALMEKDSKNFSLTASVSYGDSKYDARVTNADVVWYKITADGDKAVKTDAGVTVQYWGSEINAASSLDLTQPDCGEGAYYFTVKANYVTIFGSGYHETEKVQIARSENITVSASGINTDRVDNSSNMFTLLDTIKAEKNVMPRWKTSLSGNQQILRLYATLSKPEIRFVQNGDDMGRPASYPDGEGSLQAQNGGYYLSFHFELTGNGEPFTCKLYSDTNGDGRYSEDEQLSGLQITTSLNNIAVEPDELTANTYKLSCEVPAGAMGLVPWKLVIQSNAKSYLRCSADGYAHIAPGSSVDTLDILQINSSTGGLNLEISKQFSDTNTGLFKQVESEFKVNMMTVRADKLAGVVSDYSGYAAEAAAAAADYVKPSEASENLIEYFQKKDLSGATLSEFLQSFDMLILGFGDKYQGIDAASAEAIVDFIGTGKAILFSHDCTSFYFLPREDYRTENWSFDGKLPNYVYSEKQIIDPQFSMFGYDFNMTIRDAVGLDRYGVTNKTYGRTRYSGDAAVSGIVASQSYAPNLSMENKKALLDDYSIAYRPKSAGAYTVGETQGLTSGVLTRFYVAGGRPTSGSYSSGTEETTTITQVNKGKITTYPFNVNTEAFGGEAGVGNTITIGKTHEQYDQLNLNSDDITVWYCLAGGEFDYLPNDAVNSYYIYNRKNVTYTGFGHFEREIGDSETVNENEAKLLVNTIIASYRGIAPEISFTDATGEKPLETFLLLSDGGEIISAGSVQQNGVLKTAADPARRIHFIVGSEPEEGQKLKAQFYIEGNEAAITPQVYYQKAGAEKSLAAADSLTRGTTYYIKLDELLPLLSAAPDAAWSGGLTLTVRLGADATISTGDTLTFQKLNLFDLS